MEYTQITVEELLNKFRERLNNKRQFKQLQESQIYEKFIEMLSDCCNINNFYAQRIAEEATINSAKIDSNIIKHCQNLGYQPRRPIPAQAELIIRIKGPLPDELNQAGTEVFFSQEQTNLVYNDYKFILDSGYSYVFSQDDIDYGHDPAWHKDLVAAVPHSQSVFMPLQGINYINETNVTPIKCFQGEVKTYEVKGINVLQKIGKPNQTYNIDDLTFSNWYGVRDPFAYNGDRNFVQKNSWCKIGIGESIEDAFSSEKLFDVETQSIRLNKKYRLIQEKDSDELYNDVYELIHYNKTLDKNYKENKIKSILNKQLKICLVNSNPDKTVKVSFGNSHNVVNGLMKPSENLYIQYISTAGKSANQIGITGSTITNSNSVYVSVNGNVINITNNIEFILNSDIYGGDDFESAASMKVNGPGYFTRRNKLITIDDFQNYFSTLTSPMNVHKAYVAGQDEIERSQLTNQNLPLLQNYIIYSLVGKLYMQNEGNYEPRNILTSTDTINDPSSLYGKDYLSHIADYAKFLISPIAYTKNQYNTSFNEPWVKYAQIIRENCKDNLPMNTTLLSIPPFIHYFDLIGNVKVKPSTNLEEYSNRLKNKVYKYLDELSYSTNKIYKSDIIKLYTDDPDTEYADIDIKISSLIQSNEHVYTWKNNTKEFWFELDKTIPSYIAEVASYKNKILPTNVYGYSPFNIIRIQKYDINGKKLSARFLEKSRVQIVYTMNVKNGTQTFNKYTNCTVTEDEEYFYVYLPIVFPSSTAPDATFNDLQIIIKTTNDFVSISKLSPFRLKDYKLPLTYDNNGMLNTNAIEKIEADLVDWLNNLRTNYGADRAIDLPYEVKASNTSIRTENVERHGNIYGNHETTLSEAAFWNYFIPNILNNYYVVSDDKTKDQNGNPIKTNQFTVSTRLDDDLWIGASQLILDLYTLVKPGICDSILDDGNNITNYSLENETSVLINKINVYST